MSERKILPLFSYKNYVELKLCMALYEEVVGPTKQFTSIGDLDFINMLNLRPTLARPAIRHREKSRVCFMISKLSLLVGGKRREEVGPLGGKESFQPGLPVEHADALLVVEP